MATKKTTGKATTKATKEEKTMAKTTKKTADTAKKTTKKDTTAKKTIAKAEKVTPKVTAEVPKKTTKKTEPKTAPKKTPAPKAEVKKKAEGRDYTVLKKLESMKGGDRIYPKADKEDWYMKIPSGVYEGRFESHKLGAVLTIDKVNDRLKGVECSVSKRKALLLETFYEKKEDMYVIPKNWMTECWVEVMAKLEKGVDKDGYRFCLVADNEKYRLIEIEIEL